MLSDSRILSIATAATLAAALSGQCQPARTHLVVGPTPLNTVALSLLVSTPCAVHGQPRLGSTWCPAVLHGDPYTGNFMPNALLDFYIIALDQNPTPVMHPTAGWILADPNTVIAIHTLPAVQSPFLNPLILSIPNNQTFCGIKLMVQVAAWNGTQVQLTNGLLGTVGF